MVEKVNEGACPSSAWAGPFRGFGLDRDTPLPTTDERPVALSETAAIVLKGRRWHRRIAESWVALDVRRFALIHIAPRGCESIVKTLPGNLRIVWRGRWFGIYRSWMRTSSQRERQQQSRQGKPSLHIVSLSSYLISRQSAGATVVGINTRADEVLWRGTRVLRLSAIGNASCPLKKMPGVGQSRRFAGASEGAVGG